MVRANVSGRYQPPVDLSAISVQYLAFDPRPFKISFIRYRNPAEGSA